jgi:putative transposase
MRAQYRLFVALRHCSITTLIVLLDLVRLVGITFRPQRALAAENLFLRKQLAQFQERKVKPRCKSKATGRPPLPKDLRQLIREMAVANVTWGEERIANELKLKLGVRVSPQTVGKYLHHGRPVRMPNAGQRWLTFVRNHASNRCFRHRGLHGSVRMSNE